MSEVIVLSNHDLKQICLLQFKKKVISDFKVISKPKDELVIIAEVMKE